MTVVVAEYWALSMLGAGTPVPPDSWQEQWGDKREDGLILRLLWTDQGC